MKKIIPLLAILFFVQLPNYAQNKKMDSLKTELQNAKQDSIRLKLYMALGDECEVKDNLKYRGCKKPFFLGQC